MKINILMGTALSLLLSFSLQAAELKIGVVDNARLFSEAPQAELASKRLREEFEPKEKKLLATQKNIQAQNERLVRDGDIMSVSERETLEREVKSALRELQMNDADLKEEFAARQKKEMSILRDSLMNAIKTLAKEEEYDIILYEGVSYASPAVDITDRVLQRLAQ